MPGFKFPTRHWTPLSIANFSRGLQANARLTSEFQTFRNVYLRSDGYIVGRGQLILTQQNFGSEIPKALFLVGQDNGFSDYVVATSSNWYAITISSTTPPIQYASVTMKAFNEGTVPAYTVGQDINGNPAVFFCGFDGTTTNVFQYNGSLSTLANWTNQLMLGYWDGVLFGGGGHNGAISQSVFYSKTYDPTTVPATNVTQVSANNRTGLPIDFVVVDDIPHIITTGGMAQLTGGSNSGFPPTDKMRLLDRILARTASSSGLLLFMAGEHGVYPSHQDAKDVALPVRKFYYPYIRQVGSSVKYGSTAFSSGGYFYAIVLRNTTNGGMASGQTQDNSLLVYDIRLNYWFQVDFDNFAPFLIAPAQSVFPSGGSVLSGFAMVGYDMTNQRYTLAFWFLRDGDLANNNYQDLYVNAAGNATVPVDYTTHIQTAELNNGNPISEKHARDLLINGQTSRANVATTLYGIPAGSTSQSLVAVNAWAAASLPQNLQVPGLQQPMVRHVVDMVGKGDFIVKDFTLVGRDVRVAVGDLQPFPVVASGGATSTGNFMQADGLFDKTFTQDIQTSVGISKAFLDLGVAPGITTTDVPAGLYFALLSGSLIVYDTAGQVLNGYNPLGAQASLLWTNSSYASSSFGGFNNASGAIAADSVNSLALVHLSKAGNYQIAAVNGTTGVQSWIYNTGTAVPAIANNVLAGMMTRQVTGKLVTALIQTFTASAGSVTVLVNNTSDGSLASTTTVTYPAGGVPAGFSFNRFGACNDTQTTDNVNFTTPVAISDGTTVYFFLQVTLKKTADNTLWSVPWVFAINPTNGNVLWNYTPGGTLNGSSVPTAIAFDSSNSVPLNLQLSHDGTKLYCLYISRNAANNYGSLIIDTITPATGAVSSSLTLGITNQNNQWYFTGYDNTQVYAAIFKGTSVQAFNNSTGASVWTATAPYTLPANRILMDPNSLYCFVNNSTTANVVAIAKANGAITNNSFANFSGSGITGISLPIFDTTLQRIYFFTRNLDNKIHLTAFI